MQTNITVTYIDETTNLRKGKYKRLLLIRWRKDNESRSNNYLELLMWQDFNEGEANVSNMMRWPKDMAPESV